MAAAPGMSRRRFLALLAAGAITACSPRRTDRGAAPPATTSSSGATSTTTTTLPTPPPGVSGAAFDTVHPMSGFVAFGDFGGGPGQAGVAEAMLRWVQAGH